MHAPKNRVVKHMKQILVKLKGDTDKSTIMGIVYNMLVTTTGRVIRPKINKYAMTENTISHLDITPIYRMSQSTTENTHSF